jgi:hypothetical protein
MWVLFVVSFIAEQNEYKVTEFNRYITQQQCSINAAVLEATFENDEGVVCYYEK